MSDLSLNADLRLSDNAVLANIAAKPINQMPKDGVNAGAASQIFMNDDPGIEMPDDEIRQDTHKVTLADRYLSDADSEASPHCRELCRMAISSNGET
jgi:hypothetical protein